MSDSLKIVIFAWSLWEFAYKADSQLFGKSNSSGSEWEELNKGEVFICDLQWNLGLKFWQFSLIN